MERSLALPGSGKAIMGSSSTSTNKYCSNNYCKKSINVTRLGWECCGEKVPLCNQCFIAYEKKQFCEIYHQNAESWSHCIYCNKKLHRACFASHNHSYTALRNGIKCIDCTPPPNAALNSQETLHEVTRPPTPLASDQETSTDSEKTVDDEDYIPQSVLRSTPSPMALDPVERDLSSKAGAEINPHNKPNMTDEELNAIVKRSNEEVIPLFEKKLSNTDAGKGGRLVLPVKCAEKFFPSVDDGKSRIVIRDFKGKDWNFGYNVWSPHQKNKMYILEDFKGYVRSMRLKGGDTVTFSKLMPGGKLVIGNRKASKTRASGKKQSGGASTSKQAPNRKSKSVGIKGSSVNKDKSKAPSGARMPNAGSKRKKPEACSPSKSAPDHQATPHNGPEENRTTQEEPGSYYRALPIDFDLNEEPPSDE